MRRRRRRKTADEDNHNNTTRREEKKVKKIRRDRVGGWRGKNMRVPMHITVSHTHTKKNVGNEVQNCTCTGNLTVEIFFIPMEQRR